MSSVARPVSLVSLSLDTETVRASLGQALERLATELSAFEGSRIIFLPPLIANIAATGPGQQDDGLEYAVRASTRFRFLRSAAVRLAYPKRNAQRRRWLVHHDRVHGILRGCIANLALRTGAVVVAGTAILAIPRKHWEDWPDEGHLFHSAHSFAPDGEPFHRSRHGRPNWAVLEGASVDKAPDCEGSLLNTPFGEIAIHWDDVDPVGLAAPVKWAPRAWLQSELRADEVDHARFPPEASVNAMLSGASEGSIAVRSCLVGRLGDTLGGTSFVARCGDHGEVEAFYAPPARSVGGLSYVEVKVESPW